MPIKRVTMKKKPFYGWVVVFACMILAAASTGLLSYLNPLFVTPVTRELGISRATFMVYQTFSTVATIICTPLISSIYKKIPMKRMLFIGTLGGAAAHLCYASARSVEMFYLGGLLAGIFNCFYGAIPIAVLTSNWFYEKKGVATGIAFAGTGVVTSLLSPVISRVIVRYGWRMGYCLIAALIFAVMLPNILFLIRVTPEEMGQTPLGSKTDADGQQIPPQGFSRKQVFRTKSFWIFSAAIFLMGSVSGPAQQQLVAYWNEQGNTPAFAASMYSVVMFVAIFAKIFLGILYDRASVSKSTLAVGGVAVLSYLCLLAFPKGYSVLIPAVLFGVTVSVQVLASTYVTSRLFGDKEYAFIYGLMTPMLFGGAAVGNPLSALIYDTTGNYRILWYVCAAVFALAVGAVIVADKSSIREYRKILGTERK